ncbi:hypothetical protein OAO87_03535 [bacterium]|nr:hypothetical protein [bacterium]
MSHFFVLKGAMAFIDTVLEAATPVEAEALAAACAALYFPVYKR